MSKKKKKNSQPYMPMFPGMMPFMPFMQQNADDTSAKVDDIKSNMKTNTKTFCEQRIDMRKSSIEASRDRWNQFFEYMMSMQDSFAASLPDNEVSLPGFPSVSISPKECMKQLKEFQQMANAHFMEQADSVVDFFIKGQEQIYDAFAAANASKKEEEEPAEEDEQAEE